VGKVRAAGGESDGKETRCYHCGGKETRCCHCEDHRIDREHWLSVVDRRFDCVSLMITEATHVG